MIARATKPEVLVAIALAAVAAGLVAVIAKVTQPAPASTGRYPSGPLPTTAPIIADYQYRNAIVADLEANVRRHPDQLNSRMLAGQYLQRFREAPDVSDLKRAVASAGISMRYQPRYNASAEMTLSSAFAALHRFQIAQQHARAALRILPWDAEARAAVASLDLELGHYLEAQELLSAAPAHADAAWETVAARYAELTGDLAAARRLIDRAATEADSNAYAPAESRAWYHWRAGELAFEAGDLAAAITQYERALVTYPHYWHATNGLAKVYWAQRRWRQALDEARASADVYPMPETLGYEYDALHALHEYGAARQTEQLIDAIERLGNAQNINDRLIATFYSDHGVAVERAVVIARRDLALRDDVYSEDTLGWALAMDGCWREALPHAERAARLGTQDARLQFHTAIVELHAGQRARAMARLRRALLLNPSFHPWYAAQAVSILAHRPEPYLREEASPLRRCFGSFAVVSTVDTSCRRGDTFHCYLPTALGLRVSEAHYLNFQKVSSSEFDHL